jgi:hypothetical protein
MARSLHIGFAQFFATDREAWRIRELYTNNDNRKKLHENIA